MEVNKRMRDVNMSEYKESRIEALSMKKKQEQILISY